MATNVSHRIPTAQAHAIADRTGADIIYLTGTETIQELRQRGLPESTAHAARKRGYYCPGYNQRCYPQHDGAGGFAQPGDARALRAGLCPAHAGAVGDCPAARISSRT